MKNLLKTSLCLFFAFAPLVVLAKPVLVLMPLAVDEEDARFEEDFGTALQEGLQHRYKVFYGSKVQDELEKEYQKIDCDAERCAQNVAIAFNGELVADASTKKVANGYFIKLVIRNVFTDEIVESSSEACRNCDMFHVLDKLKKIGFGTSEEKKFSGAITTASGLQYKILRQGSGARPNKEDEVVVHYKGMFTDGRVFDSSYDRGEPITLGVTQVIPGWVEALQLMPLGSKWELTIPPELAYGSRGSGMIGPNETLIFDVELLEIKKPEDIAAKNKQRAEAFLASNRNKPGIVTTASGLQYKIIKTGSGQKPDSNDEVTVHYTGYTQDRAVFDSSYERGKPAIMGVSAVIPGWVEVLQLMPVGSKWKVFIPPELGYGKRAIGSSIGPNELLIFELELLALKSK